MRTYSVRGVPIRRQREREEGGGAPRVGREGGRRRSCDSRVKRGMMLGEVGGGWRLGQEPTEGVLTLKPG